MKKSLLLILALCFNTPEVFGSMTPRQRPYTDSMFPNAEYSLSQEQYKKDAALIKTCCTEGRADYAADIQRLLQQGASVNTRNYYDLSPLMILVYTASRVPSVSSKAVKLLLDHKADANESVNVNEGEFTRRTALGIALYQPKKENIRFDVIQALFDGKADANARNEQSGESHLTTLVHSNAPIEALDALALSPDLDLDSSDGFWPHETALTIARKKSLGRDQYIQWLLSRGAYPHCSSDDCTDCNFTLKGKEELMHSRAVKRVQKDIGTVLPPVLVPIVTDYMYAPRHR